MPRRNNRTRTPAARATDQPAVVHLAPDEVFEHYARELVAAGIRSPLILDDPRKAEKGMTT